MDITERFLKYISFDTQSADGQEEIPSTKKQFDLARLLADELREMGAQDVTVTDNCYVYAAIPSTSSRDAKTLGFISHKLNEVMEISDRISVMRQGNYMGTVEKKDTSPLDLTKRMIGREVFLDLSFRKRRFIQTDRHQVVNDGKRTV